MREDAGEWVRLSLVPGVGPRRFRELLTRFGSPAAVFQASRSALEEMPGIGPKTAEFITEKAPDIDVQPRLRWMCRHGVTLLVAGEEEYPSPLGEIYDPPVLLYLRGHLAPEGVPAVAIVGTRRATVYGRTVARRLGRQLGQRGISVVSGLARGVDTEAHRGALDVGGHTVAVLGCGPDVSYPRENRDLMEEIARTGAVLTEFPPGTRPEAGNFPRRNRIVSGLCRGVIVVEAAARSGALITADFALEQGREVLAVPGNISGATSQGTNRLIQEGARLVSDVTDILEELDLAAAAAGRTVPDELTGRADRADQGAAPALSPEEARVWNALSDAPLHVDQLIGEVGLSAATLMPLLMRLQLRGLVQELPGKHFTRGVRS